jgi:hypothetical protein
MNTVGPEESQYYTTCRKELKRVGIDSTRFTLADYARWYAGQIPREEIVRQARQEMEATA